MYFQNCFTFVIYPRNAIVNQSEFYNEKFLLHHNKIRFRSYVVIYFDNRFRKKTFGIAAEILSIEINQNDYEKLQIKLKEFIVGSNIQLDLKSMTNVNSRLEIIYSIKNETNIDNLNKFIDKFNNIGIENLNYSISKDVHLPL